MSGMTRNERYESEFTGAPRTYTWILVGKDIGTIVTIDLGTGEIKYGENYTPDVAAREFWETIGRAHKYGT